LSFIDFKDCKCDEVFFCELSITSNPCITFSCGNGVCEGEKEKIGELAVWIVNVKKDSDVVE